MSRSKDRRLAIQVDAGVLAEFEALPKGNPNWQRPFTPQEDCLLRRFWPTRNHAAVARKLGRSDTTCLKRFRELTTEE